MTPRDDMEHLLAEAPLTTASPADVERIRQRIASARPSPRSIWRHRITIGYAAAACLLVAAISAATTALVLRANGNVPRLETTSAPNQSPPAAPIAPYAGPQFVIRTDFFSTATHQPTTPQVDITEWTTHTKSRGEDK